MMFGRKKKEPEPLWTVPDYINPGNEMTARTEDATYMIGTLSDGRVQLQVGYPSSVTLTMNPVAVRKMIKLLEAAIQEEDETNDN